MKCRHCNQKLEHKFLDLGFAPPSNAYLTADQLNKAEYYFPLRLFVCEGCWLVQTEDFADAEQLFTEDYAYFSSTSSSWLKHAKNYYGMIVEKLNLNHENFVVEIASNDGYLLKNFVDGGISCLGIEPTESTGRAAERIGIPVIHEFFGESLASTLEEDGKQADLIIGNNVYAHVPDINDFTRGLKKLLKPEGTITLEFPHIMKLLEFCQFDTVYHEHFSYLSLYSVEQIFKKCGLRIYDVEELSTHGGSLRIYGCHVDDKRNTELGVAALLQEEKINGLRSLSYYYEFQSKVESIKNDLLMFLINSKNENKKIVGYGAAAKGNTLLNYAGIKSDLLPVIYDAAPSKQGKYMPGSHIEIKPPQDLMDDIPDCVLILPWNIKEELKGQLERDGIYTQFVTVIPTLEII